MALGGHHLPLLVGMHVVPQLLALVLDQVGGDGARDGAQPRLENAAVAHMVAREAARHAAEDRRTEPALAVRAHLAGVARLVARAVHVLAVRWLPVTLAALAVAAGPLVVGRLGELRPTAIGRLLLLLTAIGRLLLLLTAIGRLLLLLLLLLRGVGVRGAVVVGGRHFSFAWGVGLWLFGCCCKGGL